MHVRTPADRDERVRDGGGVPAVPPIRCVTRGIIQPSHSLSPSVFKMGTVRMPVSQASVPGGTPCRMGGGVALL